MLTGSSTARSTGCSTVSQTRLGQTLLTAAEKIAHTDSMTLFFRSRSPAPAKPGLAMEHSKTEHRGHSSQTGRTVRLPSAVGILIIVHTSRLRFTVGCLGNSGTSSVTLMRLTVY